MGELLSKEMLADLIINVINILILFFVAKALLYKPVKKYLNARREREAQTLREAEELKSEADARQKQFAALTSDAAAIKAKAIQNAQKKAERKAEEIVAAANTEAENILQSSRAAAEREREKMLSDAQEQLGALAVELSGKILGREVTDEDNRRIIESFFGEEG